MNNTNKIILDLCGGTSSWSKPYREAGYDVRVVTLPSCDVRTYEAVIYPPKHLYGILAAPPCTMFSYARTKAKKPRDLLGAMEIVAACLRIIWKAQYPEVSRTAKCTLLKFWALENPNGFLKYFLGKPAFIFDPWQFGDIYQKKTHLWGWFNEPKITVPSCGILPKFGSDKPIEFRFNAEIKSITPAGFAKAFFEANR